MILTGDVQVPLWASRDPNGRRPAEGTTCPAVQFRSKYADEVWVSGKPPGCEDPDRFARLSCY